MAEAPLQPAVWPPVTVIVPTLGDRPDLLEATLRGIRGQDYPRAITCLVVLDRRSADASRAAAGEVMAHRPDGMDTGQEGTDAGQEGMDAGQEGTDAGQEGTDAGQRASTRAVAVAAGARVLDNQRTAGLAGSRNTGILAAQDEFVAFCDDDDAWLPGKLRPQVEALVAEPAAALACCGIEIQYGDTVTRRVHPSPTVSFEELLRSRLAALHPSTFVLRRSALLNGVGLVSEEIPGSQAEDYELLLRAARHSMVLNIPTAGVRVLWHKERPAMHGSWPMVALALPWLLDRYPEFRTVPRGYARTAGRIAFAAAATGDRTTAWKWVRQAIRASAREPRPYIAMAVMSGLLRPEAVVRALHSRGHGS
jgi:glycosyltransferase involved in cell wall biosynthesis